MICEVSRINLWLLNRDGSSLRMHLLRLRAFVPALIWTQEMSVFLHQCINVAEVSSVDATGPTSQHILRRLWVVQNVKFLFEDRHTIASEFHDFLKVDILKLILILFFYI